MRGAIIGDIVGSVYEAKRIKTTDFPLFGPTSQFTDDSVLTLAVAQSLLDERPYAQTLREFGRRHPDAGYGGAFFTWLLRANPQPYNSWGNGAAMRVSAVGWARDDVDGVLAEAQRSAEVTHDHPHGIRGAQATALAVFLARTGAGKDAIRREIAARFGYDLDRRVDDIRPEYSFDVSCQGSVPEAILCFLESRDYLDAIRLAVSLGGDSDTQACIAGAIAQAHYRTIPPDVSAEAEQRLTPDLREVLQRFEARFGS